MSAAKVCFITAIFGNYEASCKLPAEQTISADFVCFTDNPNIVANGWAIDTTPYHITHPSPMDSGLYNNSLAKNRHTFNLAKYYKTAFVNIPRLQQYDIIVWLDGTVQITNPKCAEWLLDNTSKRGGVIGWVHEERNGQLSREIQPSINCGRYCTTHWNWQSQTYQDVTAQYESYVRDGYCDFFFYERDPQKKNFGLWLTCFVAFDNKSADVRRFIDAWYYEILTHTTQDQISFPYVAWKTGIIPYTLPDADIRGNTTNTETDFYIKHTHGK